MRASFEKGLRLPTLFFYRNTGYFKPVNQFDVSKAIQKHQMGSANQGVIATLHRANGSVIRRDGKRDERFCAQKLLYLIDHRHIENNNRARSFV
jgi:hypothetical protein